MKIKKVKILQHEMKELTDTYCSIQFVNGECVGLFSDRDLARLKALIPVEVTEYDLDVPDVETLIALVEKYNAGEIKLGTSKVAEVKEDEKPSEEPKQEEPKEESESKESVALYTKEELEAVADKDGIAGLRELADKHEIKGRSINELIGELLEVKE